MMARQFCRLVEVHSHDYRRQASGEIGRKLTVGTCVGAQGRLVIYLG